MNNKKQLHVFLHGQKVGTLAETQEHLVAFAYEDAWLADGFSISPFSLPLRTGVFTAKGYDPFEGLFGVFADSLPDGWGRLLVDRFLRKHDLNPAEVSPLTRLAIVGSSGMGALEYRPSEALNLMPSGMSLDELAHECQKMFDTEDSAHLDELFQRGGSSGGARPKINYEIDEEEWIVKFPSSLDGKNIGQQEYDYSLCAKKCDLKMAETRLLPSDFCEGYFATKRFDRNQEEKIHMVSASGLLETSHRLPNLDYNTLMQLTIQLTKNFEDVEQLYRLMCFNVFAHNRDDHSKNFSFLCKEGKWSLSPAYDLTYSYSIGGEHATTVNGNGSNPGLSEILQVASSINMDASKARDIAGEIQTIVCEDLQEYLR